jgi:predicted  nucleic acid-binding Zn-ribbon protein
MAKSHKETNKMTEKMIQTLDEIENTQKILETLSAEQSDLSVKMSVAANDADSASLIALSHRRNNLPIEILSAQIRLERLLLLRDELRLPQLQGEVAELAKPIPEMQKQINDLQREFNIASGEVSNASENLRQTRLEISERRRSIESLLAQARNVKIAPASLQMHGGR